MPSFLSKLNIMGNDLSSPSPEQSSTHRCSIHTTPHPQCQSCNDAPYSSLVTTRSSSLDASNKCPYHTLGAPHPHCDHCNGQPLWNPPRTFNPAPPPPGSCQVHTTPNAFCQRCNGGSYNSLLPGPASAPEAPRKCSLHASLSAPHPLCSRCNDTSHTTAPVAVQRAPPVDSLAYAPTSCNVHGRRNPNLQCVACNSAALRELTAGSLTASGAIPRSTCNRHSAETPHANCSSCNGTPIDGPVLVSIPSSENLSSLSRSPPTRCHRHENSAPNPNCQTCNPVGTRGPVSRIATEDDPPPTYDASPADRLVATPTAEQPPHSPLRAPSYSSTAPTDTQETIRPSHNFRVPSYRSTAADGTSQTADTPQAESAPDPTPTSSSREADVYDDRGFFAQLTGSMAPMNRQRQGETHGHAHGQRTHGHSHRHAHVAALNAQTVFTNSGNTTMGAQGGF